MKILIVCSGNKADFNFERNQPFIYDQVNAIMALDEDIEFDYFFIKGKGISGYLKNLGQLKRHIKEFNPDLIHAHYAYSGLLANLQRTVRVITTYHGTDINNLRIRVFSRITYRLSIYSIIVSVKMVRKLLPQKNFSVIPCGVDMDVFHPMDKTVSRRKLGLNPEKRYVLFSSSFQNHIKNYPLAESAVNMLNDNIELLEFSGYSRSESAILFNAVDVALMTSFSEGSPQFIKEAMSCNCPVVSTNVGDVSDVITGVESCYLTSFETEDVAEKIKMALDYNKKTNGRESINHLSNVLIAKQIVEIYRKCLQSKR